MQDLPPHSLSPLELPRSLDLHLCGRGAGGEQTLGPDELTLLSVLQQNQHVCHAPVACLQSFCATTGLESPFPVSLLKPSSLFRTPLSPPPCIQPDNPPNPAARIPETQRQLLPRHQSGSGLTPGPIVCTLIPAIQGTQAMTER